MGLNFKMSKKEMQELYLKELLNKFFLDKLKEYGLTEEDLKYLPVALKKVKEFKEQNVRNYELPKELTEKQKKIIKDIENNRLSVNDHVGMFGGNVEELNIGGK